MQIGILKENRAHENRVAGTPESVKKLLKNKVSIAIEKDAGLSAGFRSADYSTPAEASRAAVLQSDVVFSVRLPSAEDISRMKKGGLLVCFTEPPLSPAVASALQQNSINCMSVEMIPRISRAQSMDALSSQANIVGYRAVLEASNRYGRFLPMNMTAAGMAKPARVLILGAGVAGLQAIATAKRLGSKVEAFDVRSEVKEQIESLGAKFFEVSLQEEGAGQGGYAKALSEESQNRIREAIAEKCKSIDIVISTASIPGRKAPLLLTETAVKNMRTGSVIVDLAAATGGNCALTQADQSIQMHGVHIIGITYFASLIPTDASNFYAQNLVNLSALFLKEENGDCQLNLDLSDEIILKSLVCHQGKLKDTA